MATEFPGKEVTKIAAASYVSGRQRACALDSSGKAAVPAAGGHIYGVVQNNPDVGQSATVMLDGVTKMEAGAAIAAGADVMVDSSGRCITWTTGNSIIGTAEVAAGASGVYISVHLDRGGLTG